MFVTAEPEDRPRQGKTVTNKQAHRVVSAVREHPLHVGTCADRDGRYSGSAIRSRRGSGNVSAALAQQYVATRPLIHAALFSKTMLNDHLPSHYERSTQLLLDGSGQAGV